jgi:hypothetical protein
MKLLTIDPSMTCTGYAVLEGRPGEQGTIVQCGCVTTDGSTHGTRVNHLAAQLRALRQEARPDLVVVETPFARARGGPKAQRSAMTLPTYGMAVGAALLVAHEGRRVVETPSDEWSVGLTKGKRRTGAGVLVADDHKGARVAAVQYFYGVDLLETWPASKAGNVADAILMGRFVLMRMEAEAA